MPLTAGRMEGSAFQVVFISFEITQTYRGYVIEYNKITRWTACRWKLNANIATTASVMFTMCLNQRVSMMKFGMFFVM